MEREKLIEALELVKSLEHDAHDAGNGEAATELFTAREAIERVLTGGV